jgi:hypothetical protein
MEIKKSPEYLENLQGGSPPNNDQVQIKSITLADFNTCYEILAQAQTPTSMKCGREINSTYMVH